MHDRLFASLSRGVSLEDRARGRGQRGVGGREHDWGRVRMRADERRETGLEGEEEEEGCGL